MIVSDGEDSPSGTPLAESYEALSDGRPLLPMMEPARQEVLVCHSRGGDHDCCEEARGDDSAMVCTSRDVGSSFESAHNAFRAVALQYPEAAEHTAALSTILSQLTAVAD